MSFGGEFFSLFLGRVCKGGEFDAASFSQNEASLESLFHQISRCELCRLCKFSHTKVSREDCEVKWEILQPILKQLTSRLNAGVKENVKIKFESAVSKMLANSLCVTLLPQENLLGLRQTSLVKCRVAKDLVTQSEISVCKEFLQDEVRLSKTRLLVSFGEAAFCEISGFRGAFSSVVGGVFRLGERLILVQNEPFVFMRNLESKAALLEKILRLSSKGL